MKNIFLDCGTHLGWGFEHFRKQYGFDQTWDIHLFEPNPNLKDYINEHIINRYPQLNIYYHPIAVCASNAPNVAEFNLQPCGKDPKGVHPEGFTGGGSSLLGDLCFKPEEIAGYEKVDVQTMPFVKILSQLVEDAYNENPSICSVQEHEDGSTSTTVLKGRCNIIVKLDVEGLEYEILPELIKSNLGSWISHLWIEFHRRRFKNESHLRQLEINTVGELFQMGVVCFPHW